MKHPMKRRYSSTVVGFPIPQHLSVMKHRQLNRKSLTGACAQVRATGDLLNCEICPLSSACALGEKECEFTETQPKLNQ
jgi:hypothetical protein